VARRCKICGRASQPVSPTGPAGNCKLCDDVRVDQGHGFKDTQSGGDYDVCVGHWFAFSFVQSQGLTLGFFGSGGAARVGVYGRTVDAVYHRRECTMDYRRTP
jgi:hypothetical protein